MAKGGRTWDGVIARLGFAPPLGLSSDWPRDVSDAIAFDATHPELFGMAFGDVTITPVRSALRAGEFDSLQEVIGLSARGSGSEEPRCADAGSSSRFRSGRARSVLGWWIHRFMS
jgi:hypothetical protein